MLAKIKFVVRWFLIYMMVNSKTLNSNVLEFKVNLNDIHIGDMTLNESFQLATIIEKLPFGWKDFKVTSMKKKCIIF